LYPKGLNNGEIPNKPLRVIADYFVHITQYVYRHKPDVYCDFVYSDIPAICDGSTANRRQRIWDPGCMQNIDTASIMNQKAPFLHLLLVKYYGTVIGKTS
jgi:hypothetical protein